MIKDLHNRPGTILAIILLLMIIGPVVRDLFSPDTENASLPPSVTPPNMTGPQSRKTENPKPEQPEASEKPAAPDATADLSATKPELAFPVACTLGENCWIARYMDRGLGESVSDYRCNASTQDGHKGTDIAVSDMARMHGGMDVLAAAPGKVARIRDDMDDVSVQKIGQKAIADRECGNAAIIEHNDGWQTQYCHMKKNSVTITPGQIVRAGDKIGEIGLSGQTEYPHLHFSVRHNKQDIDPFDGGHFEAGCNGTDTPLWQEHITYQEMTLMPAIFSAAPRDLQESWEKGADTLPSDGAGLVLTARVFHARVGDRLQFIIKNPDGETFLEGDHVIDRDRQYMIQYLGKKRPGGGFSPGLWRGEVILSRAGAASQKQTVQVTINP